MRLHCKYSELKRNQRPNRRTVEASPRDSLGQADGPRPSERRNRIDGSHNYHKNRRDSPPCTWSAAAMSNDGIQQCFYGMKLGLRFFCTSRGSPVLDPHQPTRCREGNLAPTSPPTFRGPAPTARLEPWSLSSRRRAQSGDGGVGWVFCLR